MAFTEDLSPFFDVAGGFAESITLAGVSRTAIVDVDTPLLLGDVLRDATTVQLPAPSAPAAAEGQACVVRGVGYVVRQVLRDPPDGATLTLVLGKV